MRNVTGKEAEKLTMGSPMTGRLPYSPSSVGKKTRKNNETASDNQKKKEPNRRRAIVGYADEPGNLHSVRKRTAFSERKATLVIHGKKAG